MRAVEDVVPEFELIDEGGRLRYTYEQKERKNPVYSSLSERVKEIMERWRHDELSATEALQELEELEQREKDLGSQQEERNLSDVEFALFKLIQTKYEQFVEDPDQAEELAIAINQATSGLSLEGNLSQIKRELRARVIRVLVDQQRIDLAKYNEKAFLDDAIQYIVANAGG